MKLPRICHAKGFTIIEILIVLGLIALLAGVGAVIGFDAVGRATAAGERDILVSLLVSARTKAMANVGEIEHGVYISPTEFILFDGASYGSSDPATHRPVDRTGAVSVTGDTEVVFSQLSGGVAAGDRSITLTDGASDAVIDINSAGRIEW